jgi:Dolichyl-phosphate-mannose-protein mannosyltransferase
MKMNRLIHRNTTTFLLCATIFVFFSAEFILNLTPPISRDALIHHLAVPKLWLEHGEIYEMPWADYAYYPMNIDLLYAVCLYFNNDISPKFIHLAFGLGIGLLIYFYIKLRFDRNWGLLCMIIFITTPIVIWLSTTAYIDLGVTFFTTSSVMAFIRWRDTKYGQFKWFLISSLAMGMALGSKYNALIAWFIVNLMVMFSYAQDTNRQTGALRYGILFFVITALVASPWYLKNYLQTGNPFYPLFNSIISSLHQNSIQEVLHGQVIEKTGQISFFKMREVMYGESFWETLLIPIRMFFQGKDTSYQYFQGSLNPILIIFLPFVLINKRYGKDKIFFLSFTIIFIFIAYFSTEKQVRYILPVLPFLSILAVMGIKDLLDKLGKETSISTRQYGKNIQLIAKFVVLSTVIILLILNSLYLTRRMNIIKPFPYILGKETKDAFLKRHLLHYDAVKYINNNLPNNAVVFTMFLGRRGYYLERAYKNETSFGMSTIKHMVNSSNDEEKFVEYIRSMNVTHILMRTDLFSKYLQDNFSKKEVKRILKLISKYWKKVYENNGYSVWDIHAKLR